jgi:hypothetical protein
LRGFLGEANFCQIHGRVGELPWHLEKEGDSKSYYQYGATLSAQDLAAHIPNILLPDDQNDMGLRLARIMGDADVIVFVGFGFHESNMRKLPFSDTASPANKKRYFFSINVVEPPAGLLGNSIQHRQGQVDHVIGNFFEDLVSGDLLLMENAPLRGRVLK